MVQTPCSLTERKQLADQLQSPLPIILISIKVVPSLQLYRHKLFYLDSLTNHGSSLLYIHIAHLCQVSKASKHWMRCDWEQVSTVSCQLPLRFRWPWACWQGLQGQRQASVGIGLGWTLRAVQAVPRAWVRLTSPASIIGVFLLHEWSHLFFSQAAASS